MVELKLNKRGRGLEDESPSRVNWNAIGVIATIAVALLGWLFAGLNDYHSADKALDKRVTTLEVQRAEDVENRKQQRVEDQQWRENVNDTLQKILERLPRGSSR
jgi:hypothetical protein